MKNHKILIVDDETEFLDLMEEILVDEGFEVVSAINGQIALEKLAQQGPFSVFIVDYKMPVMKGMEFLQIAKRLSPNTPRILVTAYQTAEMMEDSINKAEVFRFLTKPVDIENMLAAIRSAIDRYEYILRESENNRHKDELIKTISDALEQSPVTKDKLLMDRSSDASGLLEDETFQIDMFDMLSSLSTALDIVNPTLSEHHKRTCYIASSLAEELQLPTREISSVFMASIMHDIGAIALSDRFKLLGFEEKSPHEHAELGALLLLSFPPFAIFAPLVRYHHVPWDNGKGKTFEGHSVPLSSHLIHLADRVAVQVRQKRPVFEEALSIQEKITSGSGEIFVPQHVDAFQSLSKQEAFWLDVISPSLNQILREKSQLPDISLNLNGLEDLARFFSNIIDSRSHFTATHSSGVSSCAEKLAALMGMTPQQCQQMKIAGYLHDLGKLAVPESILESPAQLKVEEKNIIRSHTYYTFSILKEVRGLDEITAWASFHHETLTGDGYPFHRRADKLPLGSRVLAVADVFTAMTEDRPYRKGMDKEKIQDNFSKMTAEMKVDKSIVDTLMMNFELLNQARVKAQKEHYDELLPFWNRRKELLAGINKNS